MFNISGTEKKLLKTALLLGALNLVISPATEENGGPEWLLLVMTNAFALFGLHELGKLRRPGSNMLSSLASNLSGLFSFNLAARLEVDNAVRNIINGGAAIVDKASEKVTLFINR